MILDPDDRERFYKLHKALILFVNQRLEIVEAPTASSKTIVALPPDQRLKVRDALVENTSLIDEFVEENPFDFAPEELDVVRSWKHLVAGEFYVLRFLKKYTVFLTDREPSVAYGVVALSDPFEVLIRQPLPYLCKTVLLPFQGRIVYDGILSGYNLLIGPGIRRRLNDTYNQAKNRYGIVTSLPWSSETPQSAPKRVTSRKKQSKRGGRIDRPLADHLDGKLGTTTSTTRRSKGSSNSTRVDPASSSSVTSGGTSTTGRSSGTESPPSSSPGMETTRSDPAHGAGLGDPRRG